MGADALFGDAAEGGEVDKKERSKAAGDDR